MPTLWAVADLHGAIRENFARIAELAPPDPADWLIVAGDVAERSELIVRILRDLAARYDTVIWAPGNHELFSRSQDQYKGREKYDHLVAACREIGVITPEDPYPVFNGITIVPRFYPV